MKVLNMNNYIVKKKKMHKNKGLKNTLFQIYLFTITKNLRIFV
jgi:hypothetical protein